MKESISSRVSRLISGSINAIIEKAENISPELIMKESINEMDSTIDEVKVLFGKETVNKKLTKTQLENEKNKYEKLNDQMFIALKENREDLVKAAISRQMDIETQVPILEERLSEINNNFKKLENYIDALNAKKREMQKELDDFIKINKEESVSKDIGVNMEKATDAFNRVNTMLKSKLKDDDIKLSELDKLARDNRINERLESLRAEAKDL